MQRSNTVRLFWLFVLWLALLIILLLAIAGVILGAIAVDWLAGGRIKTDGSCKFEDPCYHGFKVQGECFGRYPKKDGVRCNVTSCQVPLETGYGECRFREYDPLGHLQKQSLCFGEESVGNCLITNDCPNLTYAAFNTAPDDKDCDSQACYYTLDLTGGENSDIETDCTVDSPVWQQVCYAKLASNSSYVEDNCLVAQPLCFANGTIQGCEYFFREAVPQEIIILKRRNEERGSDNLNRLHNLVVHDIPSAA